MTNSSPIIPGFHAPAVGFEDPHGMLNACHERVQRSLDLLGRLVTHFDQHGASDATQSAARDVLRYFNLAAPLHHQDEELHLFPPLLARAEPQLVTHVRRLQQDHAEMERLWKTIAPILERMTEPNPPALEAAQREVIETFRALYPPHIALENECIFPAAFALLGPQASARAGQEMQERRRSGHN